MLQWFEHLKGMSESSKQKKISKEYCDFDKITYDK